MAQTLPQLLDLIRKDTDVITGLESQLGKAEKRRADRMTRARGMGATADELAEIIGKSAARVKQLAPTGGRGGRPRKSPAEQAPAAPAGEEPDPERLPAAYRPPLTLDELPDRFRPGCTAGLPLLSDLVTNRWGIKGPEKATIFVDMATGRWVSVRGITGQLQWEQRSAAELLRQIPERVERVYLVGARPQAPGIPDAAEAVRAWFLTSVPGWTPGDHYLENADLPTGRWTAAGGPGDGREVEVLRAASWFGDGDYSAEDAAGAWALLRVMIASRFDSGALMLSTPSTTGRDLFRRSIGIDKKGRPKTYPVLSDELRQLIQSTSGQGRWEVLPDGPQEIECFTHWDMRFAYSALAWGMPVGAPTMVTGAQFGKLTDDQQAATLMRRGRWLVTAEVPSGWEHVGILGAPADDNLWTYPRRPGERFTTWAGGSEVSMARQHGWNITVHEGFHFAEDKPLNDWKTKLTELYLYTEKRDDISPDLRKLVQGALRMLVLTTVGAFASRSHPVTKSIPATRQNERKLPKTAPVRVVGDHYVWTEQGERSLWSRMTDHPEWSAEIWSRCRARLLDSPTADKTTRAGALHVPPGTVLAMRTDGLSLACDPGWTDDGTVGLFRLKGRISHSIARPVNEAEGEAVRKLAARTLAGEA